jgi:RNA recognition motif-containing protein
MVPGAVFLEVLMAMKLFVGNLPFTTTAPDLEDLFSQAGAVESAHIITDKVTGKSRGFGFVEMAEQREARAAIEHFNGYELHGRALTVNEAKPQTERFGDRRPAARDKRSAFGGGGQGWKRASGDRGRRW